MHTQDRNQDSVKRAVRTEIRTIGSIRSGNRDSVQCTLRTRIGTVGSVHSGYESGQWEACSQDRNQDNGKCTLMESGQCAVYTRDKNRYSGKCTLKTEIETVCSVHSGQESRQWEVYT